MLHANDAPNTALPFVLCLVLLLMHAERCCGYTMSISSYGSVIPAKVLWDGGGSLAVLNLSGCSWNTSYVFSMPYLVLNTSNASEPFTFAGSGGGALLRAAAFPTGSLIANNSVSNVTSLLVTIHPAPGFVTATNITLFGLAVNSTFASGCSSSNTTSNITILANPDGGFATFVTTAVNEFDFQRVGINVTVTLRYNTFWWWPVVRPAPTSAAPQVVTAGLSAVAAASIGGLINSTGWDLTLLSPYRMLATHPPVPSFDLNSTDVATILFNISGLTYLPGGKLTSPCRRGSSCLLRAICRDDSGRATSKRDCCGSDYSEPVERGLLSE